MFKLRNKNCLFFPSFQGGMTKSMSLCFSQQLCPLIFFKITNTNFKGLNERNSKKNPKFKVIFRDRAVVWIIFCLFN